MIFRKIVQLTLIIGLLSFNTTVHSTPIQWKVENGGNGHWYEKVDAQVDWLSAKNSAESTLYQGKFGHLVTITSVEENLWITNYISTEEIWIGGYQKDGSQEPGGGWAWVTGEEWNYSNWSSSSPNDSPHNEDGLLLYYPTNEDGVSWDDRNRSQIRDGYIVEYENSGFINYEDSDNDGVIDQLDSCLNTPLGSYTDKTGCAATNLYTQEQVDKIIKAILLWGDIDGDGKICITEAVHALQVSSGVTDPEFQK